MSISQQQMQEFMKIADQHQSEAEQVQMLKELTSLMTINSHKGETMQKIMDYKQEMCMVIENIKNLEVFSCINVDLTENFLSNLQLNQI